MDQANCRICQRPIVKRFDGTCRYVMELEPGVFKRCGLERNALVDPVDPHAWDGGYDHIRDGRDVAICLCGHPKHGEVCSACHDRHDTWTNSAHGYQPGIIELDHEARE